MIKRILSVAATVALILLLGACLGEWRDGSVSLASDVEPAISFGGRDE